MTGTPLLELKGISKAFPGVLANDNVDLSIYPGEIHALLGENGAGKSTLVKTMYGLLHADSGELHWNGERIVIANPNAARNLGIGMVFQHFSLFEAMTVRENIALGLEASQSRGDLDTRITEVSKAYGLELDPTRGVHSLSVGERQRIEIVRCLLQNPKLLVMDEPTSVLTPQEVDGLFETLRRLAEVSCSILYISHKLDEIKVLCEHATILRGGKVVAECNPREESARSLAEMMIGSTLKVPVASDKKAGAVKLQVKHLNRPAEDDFAVELKDISFELRAGEVLGIAGVAGNGQAELLQVLSGEVLASTNEAISLHGVPCGKSGIKVRRGHGLTFVPEERLGHGAVPDMSLVDNTILSGYSRQALLNRSFIRYSKARDCAEIICEKFNVKQGGLDSVASSLSGGNLQKFIVGREILQEPEVMIAAQPTWGVDAGSAAAIHQALLSLAEQGTAVLALSQDLDELLTISDRIAVIFHGHLSDAMPVSEVTAESLGLLMGGSQAKHGQTADAA
ncbi:MAG: ABC transporter ATP-binding protein [Gammaproteobacteria bacterium]|nr:ABC transporter ATP-binding protein [Gammaproteobacteria bacterium]